MFGRRALLLAALLTCAAPASAQQRETRIAQMDHDGEFRIWNPRGSVHVIGWDRDSVQVVADLDVAARHGHVVQEDVAVGVAPRGGDDVLEVELGARVGAPGDDEAPAGADLLDFLLGP